MAFNGSEAEQVTLAFASKLTKAYREKNPNSTKAHFFGREILVKILAQPDCMGLRVYYGLDDEGSKQMVIVGADSKENDIINGVLLEAVIAEVAVQCPPNCSNPNPLNSDL